MTCIVCGQAIDYPLMKQMNGAPKGTPLCVDCITAVSARQVGVVRKPDGGYEVVDGRGRA